MASFDKEDVNIDSTGGHPSSSSRGLAIEQQRRSAPSIIG